MGCWQTGDGGHVGDHVHDRGYGAHQDYERAGVRDRQRNAGAYGLVMALDETSLFFIPFREVFCNSWC